MPWTMGMKEGGCAANSQEPAPDVNGVWDLTYDPTISVEVGIGGAIYQETIGVEGGDFTIDHGGFTLPFDLDCAREDVVCPQEAWPTSVVVEQRQPQFPHRMWVRIPQQQCSQSLVTPDPSMCGEGTNNPNCDPVCMGEVVTEIADAFGVIDNAGESFDLFLGATGATNGVNCAMLGISSASANLVTTGSAETEDWSATEMESGSVVVGYGGGCLWAGDPNMDGELEALLLTASLRFENGFVGIRR